MNSHPLEPDPEPCPRGCGYLNRHIWRRPSLGGPAELEQGRWFAPQIKPRDECPGCRREALRPEAWPPPEPTAWTCSRLGCEVQLPHTWQDGPWDGPQHERGQWLHPEVFACEVHADEDAVAEAQRLVRYARSEAGLPDRLQVYSFDEYQEMTDSAGRFIALSARAALPAGDFAAFQAALPAGVLGITPWNRGIAQRLRRMCAPGGTVQTTLITGPVGTGKSTLVAATVAGLIARHQSVYYVSESDMLEQFRVEARDRSKKGLGFVARLGRVPVLAIDDLGTVEAPKRWHLDLMEQLVTTRYDRRLPMLITTNADFQDLAETYGERVVSRLVEMTDRAQESLTGPDWRSGMMRVSTAPDADPDAICATCARTPCKCPCPECGYHPCRGSGSCQ